MDKRSVKKNSEVRSMKGKKLVCTGTVHVHASSWTIDNPNNAIKMTNILMLHGI